MNRSAKEQVYFERIPEFERKSSNIKSWIPRGAKTLYFNCSVGPVKVSFRLNSQNDTYMIRGMLPCENGNNNEINDFINGLEEKDLY